MSITCAQTIDFATTISSISRSVNTVLDIGSGLRPQTLVSAKTTICCEPYAGYAARLIERCDNGENICVLNFDWETVIELLPSKCVDTVTLINVLQHLDKSKARELLQKTERLSRHQIIVVTLPEPSGAYEFEPGYDIAPPKGQLLQLRSSWKPGDFDSTWQIIQPKGELHFDSQKKTPAEMFCALKNIKSNIKSTSPSMAESDDEKLFQVLALIGAFEPTLSLKDASQVRRILSLVNGDASSEPANSSDLSDLGLSDLGLIESLLEQNYRRSKYITHARRGITDLRRSLQEQLALCNRQDAEIARKTSEVEKTRELLRHRDDLITDLTYQYLTLSSSTREKDAQILELSKHLQEIKTGLTWRLASFLGRLGRRFKSF